MTDNTELLKDLLRAKVEFQQRAIRTILGIPAEQTSDEGIEQ